jgi:hypothetical protein
VHGRWNEPRRIKKRGLRNRRKFLSIKAKSSRGRALKNVLTAKKGLFWGDLAEKQGGRARKRTFFLVFFLFVGVFSPASR